MKSLLPIALVSGMLAGFAALASPAFATSPGRNGLLVYEVHVGSHTQLFTVKPDGTAARQVTHFKASDAIFPAWSPNGTKIAFERDFADHAGIYTMNADGSGLRSLTPHELNGQPSWSSDGKRITFGRYVPAVEASIWIMDANGHNLRRVTKNPLPKNDHCDGCAGQGTSVFSPDGKRIAFAWVKGAHSSAIFTVNLDGTHLKRLTSWSATVADRIDWSPDGSKIAFSSPQFGTGASANVSTVNADGSGLLQITSDVGGTVNNGLDSWSPDGTKIAFVSNRSGTYEIYTMNADGTGVTQLTTGPEAHHAFWGTHP